MICNYLSFLFNTLSLFEHMPSLPTLTPTFLQLCKNFMNNLSNRDVFVVVSEGSSKLGLLLRGPFLI
jgi:hypothetical protein